MQARQEENMTKENKTESKVGRHTAGDHNIKYFQQLGPASDYLL